MEFFGLAVNVSEDLGLGSSAIDMSCAGLACHFGFLGKGSFEFCPEAPQGLGHAFPGTAAEHQGSDNPRALKTTYLDSQVAGNNQYTSK